MPSIEYIGASRLGIIPMFLDPTDTRSMKDQIAERYIGGWHPMDGWSVKNSGVPFEAVATYPEDPPYREAGRIMMGEETLILFEPGSFAAIIQPDGSFEVSRCD